ncbi:glycosyltransferase [Vicingaceae bacterium]|nr:glycosyltransferase [Vicingaceae bacterium]
MSKSFAIIFPHYNEEVLILKFLAELEYTYSYTLSKFKVIVVNDYSSNKTAQLLNRYIPTF